VCEKLRVATILGARPQFIKAALVSEKIKIQNNISEIIIHTGQHFDRNMSKIFFDEMNLSIPKYNLGVNRINFPKIINVMIKKIKPILLQEKIDGVLVYGDTNSTLAGAIAAKMLNLPIFHIEAGLRSYNRLMQEENNRVITDHLSSLLFCPTKSAYKNLLKENLSNGLVLSGDVMYDAYLKFSSLNNKLDYDFIESSYLLATIHRRENINSYEKLSSIFKSLNQINIYKKIVMPIHPHTLKKITEYKIKSDITFIEPAGYTSMLKILNACEMVITDSGGLQKESFFAKKKCLIVRDKTEWVDLLSCGTSILCEPKKIKHAYENFKKIECDFSKNFFGDGFASNLVVESLEKFYT
tara:strand:- start:46 stop:1110 length:1065 start_codon:yes stop_codon:yes gene_type:complete